MAVLPMPGAGMLSIADAEFLLSQVIDKYMEQYTLMAGDPRINWAEGLADVVPMAMSKARLPWMELTEGFTEWEGVDKYWEGVTIRDLIVECKPLEKSLQIDRRQSLMEILQRIVNLTINLARAVALFKPRLIAQALLDGETGGASYKGFKFYDGLPAFSKVHPVNISDSGLGVWPNLFDNRPLTLANLEEAIHDFANVADPSGESMGCMPTHLIVPGTLSQTARRLCESDTIGRLLKDTANAAAGAGESNFRAGEIKPVIASQLTRGFPKRNQPGSKVDWYLADRSPGRKPIGLFVLQDPVDMPENGLIRGDTPLVRFGKEASAGAAIVQPWFIQKNHG